MVAINVMGFPTSGEANNGWKLWITTTVMVIAAGFFTIARCAIRIYKRSFGADDYTIVGALVFAVFTATAVLMAIRNGYGKHIDDLTTEQSQTALMWFFVAQTPYKITVCLNKLSALLLFRRIFVQRGFQIACWSICGIVMGWCIGTVAGTIFQCIPLEASWNRSLDGTCIDKGAFWIAYAVGNILTDVLVLVLPIPPVLQLKMPWRQRALLCGVFLLGGFVTITSILRTTAVQNSLANQQDITYNFITRGIWTLVEANLGIICACLPVLKQPIAWFVPRLFRDYSQWYSGKGKSRGDTGSRQLDDLASHRQRTQDTMGSGKASRYVNISAAPVKHGRRSDEEGIILEAQDFGSRKSAEVASAQSARSEEGGNLRVHSKT